MEASLLLIHPNDLETLILEAQTSQDVLESAYIQRSLYLGASWQMLNQAIVPPSQGNASALQYAIQAEHPLSERIASLSAVHYSGAVRVSEIYQALQALSADEVKKRYQFAVVQSSPEALEQELRLAELKLIYQQLQEFYFEAADENYAVLSVIQPAIRPEKLI